jgi:hypothetical protein
MDRVPSKDIERVCVCKRAVERGICVLVRQYTGGDPKNGGGVGHFQEFVQEEEHGITRSRTKLVGVKGANYWTSKLLHINQIEYFQ